MTLYEAARNGQYLVLSVQQVKAIKVLGFIMHFPVHYIYIHTHLYCFELHCVQQLFGVCRNCLAYGVTQVGQE